MSKKLMMLQIRILRSTTRFAKLQMTPACPDYVAVPTKPKYPSRSPPATTARLNPISLYKRGITTSTALPAYNFQIQIHKGVQNSHLKSPDDVYEFLKKPHRINHRAGAKSLVKNPCNTSPPTCTMCWTNRPHILEASLCQARRLGQEKSHVKH